MTPATVTTNLAPNPRWISFPPLLRFSELKLVPFPP